MKQLLVANTIEGSRWGKSHFFLGSSLSVKGSRTYTLCGELIAKMAGRFGPINPHTIIASEPYRESCAACHLAVRTLPLAEIEIPETVPGVADGEAA